MSHEIISPDVVLNINQTNGYPKLNPFNPECIFPELICLGLIETDSSNQIYSSFRQLLIDLRLDEPKMGSPDWNPFSDFIKEGDQVVIKPNLVLHHNRGKKNIDAVVVHASVIRPIIDYTILALKGTGKIIVGDAPHGDADFETIIRSNGLLDLVNYYIEERKIDLELRDFRKFVYPNGFDVSICTEVNNDPEGYKLINLKENSFLEGLSNLDKLYGSDYDRSFIVNQHLNGDHFYLISGSVMNADVVISVPKLKTHKKTGVTINLKNLVGINGDKNFLAHFRVGSPSEGGDEYPNTRSWIEKLLRYHQSFSRKYFLAPNTTSLRYLNRVTRIPFLVISKIYRRINNAPMINGGNWFGNDTTWRMCLDLNYILQFADKQGKIQESPQRKYFCVVDGIIAGEGPGPMEPDPVFSGFLAAGKNPYKTDFICTHLMGFDPLKLNLFSKSIPHRKIGYLPDDIKVIARKDGSLIDAQTLNLKFKPHPAWKGKMERDI